LNRHALNRNALNRLAASRRAMAGAAAVLAALACAPARAQPVTPPVISPPDSWQPRQAGTLRVLNKIDSTLRSVTLQVGATVRVQSLSITLRACAVRPPDLPQDAAARLTIADDRAGAPVFDGWILQNEPAASMLEHPVYDIQLAACG
jgi:hypothetical protein